MKSIIRFAALAPLLALGFAVRAAAQEATPAAGKVLILTNDRVLEGDIDRFGDHYRIRRGMGETLIAAKRGKRLCADWDDAVAFVRSQANLGDPDERLRLARWCQQHGLTADAAAEARAALEMRPTHPETKQLVQLLERSANAAPIAPPAAPPAPRIAEAAPQFDVSADALALFTTKVQPILLNACLRCHANGKGGGFQLVQPGELAARPATQRNLAMAVQQLRLDNPAASPLLVKAVSAHGTLAQPLFRDRRVVPIQTMQHWAEQLAANNPHLREAHGLPPAQQPPATVVAAPVLAPAAAPAAAPTAAPAAVPNTPSATPVVSRPVPRVDVKELPSGFSNAQEALLAGQSPLPPPSAAAVRAATSAASNLSDVYDPAGFNQLKQSVSR